MSPTLKAILLVVALFALPGQRAFGVITPKPSDLFPNKYEMDNVAQGVDPNASTSQWTFFTNTTPSSASLSGGSLNLNTGIAAARRWTATSSASHSVGSTIEIRLRVDSASDDQTAVPFAADRAFQLRLGDNNEAGILEIGLNHTYWRGSSAPSSTLTLNVDSNSDGMHVFRIAQDANSSLYSVWRDDELIGSNLVTGFAALDSVFGDNTGNYGGTGAFDYVRYDYTGGFGPIPEPSCALLLGLGGLLVWRRRAQRK